MKIFENINRIEKILENEILLKPTDDKSKFKNYKYKVGDTWQSKDGEREIAEIDGNKVFIIIGGNKRIKQIVDINDVWFEVYRDKKNKEAFDKANSNKAEEEKKKKEDEALFGYEDTIKSPQQRQIAIKALNKNIRYQGKMMKIKDFVKLMYDKGYRNVEKWSGKDTFVDDSGKNGVDALGKHSIELMYYLIDKG